MMYTSMVLLLRANTFVSWQLRCEAVNAASPGRTSAEMSAEPANTTDARAKASCISVAATVEAGIPVLEAAYPPGMVVSTGAVVKRELATGSQGWKSCMRGARAGSEHSDILRGAAFWIRVWESGDDVVRDEKCLYSDTETCMKVTCLLHTPGWNVMAELSTLTACLECQCVHEGIDS